MANETVSMVRSTWDYLTANVLQKTSQPQAGTVKERVDQNI